MADDAGGPTRTLDIHGIYRLLPHRPPFLMVDRIKESSDPGGRLVPASERPTSEELSKFAIEIAALNHDLQLELPIFLKAMTWVDFRRQEPDPLSRLIWGITGRRPDLKF